MNSGLARSLIQEYATFSGLTGGHKTPDVLNEHDEDTKHYQKFQGTSKLDCPAVIQIRGINVFPQHCYEIRQSSHQTANSLKIAKQRVLQQLKDESKTTNIPTTQHYYVKIPMCGEHKGQPIGTSATINHCVDRCIISKIYELVQKGVTHPEEVRRCINEFVERELFANVSSQERPKKSSTKFYPTRQDLRNHIMKAIATSKYSKMIRSH